MIFSYIASLTGCLILVGVTYRLFKPHKDIKIALQAMLIAAGIVLVAMPGFSSISAKAGPLEVALATEVAGQLKAYSQIADGYADLIKETQGQSETSQKIWAKGRKMQMSSDIIEDGIANDDIIQATIGVRRGTQNIQELLNILNIATGQVNE